MKRTVPLLMASLLLTGAGGPPVGLRACPQATSPTFHFGPGTFEAEANFDTFVREWFAQPLRRSSEPSLSCGPASAESYRFIWLRTFDHPIVVRVSAWDHWHELAATELDGKGGYDPGRPARRVRRALDAGEWQALRDAVDASDLWSVPRWGPRDERGLDGAEWVVEGRRGDEYVIVDRWSPHDGPYRELGLAFLDLADMRPPADRIY